jgi:hypothetical protein
MDNESISISSDSSRTLDNLDRAVRAEGQHDVDAEVSHALFLSSSLANSRILRFPRSPTLAFKKAMVLKGHRRLALRHRQS